MAMISGAPQGKQQYLKINRKTRKVGTKHGGSTAIGFGAATTSKVSKLGRAASTRASTRTSTRTSTGRKRH